MFPVPTLDQGIDAPQIVKRILILTYNFSWYFTLCKQRQREKRIKYLVDVGNCVLGPGVLHHNTHLQLLTLLALLVEALLKASKDYGGDVI